MFNFRKTPIYLKWWFFGLFLFLPVNWVIFIFISVLLHELGHINSALNLGYKVEKGFIDILHAGAIIDSSYTNNNNHAIKIAWAGPLVNLLLTILSVMFLFVFIGNEFMFDQIVAFLLINLILFISNILPIYPLDGGRILLASISKVRDKNKSIVITSSISIILSIILMVYSLLYSHYLIAIFLILFIIINAFRIKYKDGDGL